MKKIITVFGVLLFVSFIITSCGEQSKDTVYNIGTEIAEGVGTSLAIGFSVADPDLDYEIVTSNSEFSSEGHTWPIIDVSINVESSVLGNPKITFVLLLEIDQTDGTVVGTVKNIRVDGNQEPSLDVMNNTMYIETEEGTEQVQLVNGELQIVAY
jgi:hypothetical protein